MHPAPSLAEAPPKTNESTTGAATPGSGSGGGGGGGAQQPPPTPRQSASPPMRKDTTSSISTQATSTTSTSGATSLSIETNNSSYGSETSPSPHQSIFSLKDGIDVSNNRRASRRRTGPLSQQQREKAALIRKLGACNDCRRRRVACHPQHHNMSWEDAMKKYHRAHSPTIQDIAPLGPGGPIIAAPPNNIPQPRFTHDPQEMDIDPPAHQAGRPPLSETRNRTPLPSGPRVEKTMTSLPGIESLKTEPQANVSKLLSTANRNRYTAVQALLLYWQDDDDFGVQNAVQDLATVLDKQYRYAVQTQTIPSSSDGYKSSYKWLSRKINDFTGDRDQRDVLKIVYYNGHSFLDGNREMVLASSRDREKASTIRWSGIQQSLEEACADTLIIMDAAYHASSQMIREKGVLEFIAAAVSEDHFRLLDRSTFTRALTEQLRAHASRGYANPLSAAQAHSRLVFGYPKMILDRHPDKEAISSFPTPLHMQLSGNPRLPSILLAPLQRTGLPFSAEQSGHQLQLSLRLADGEIDYESLNEWFRQMPPAVKDAKVDNVYPVFR